jgi:hypothetical protein
MKIMWPTSRSGIRSSQEIAAKVHRKQWLLFESECMGKIMRQCWNGGHAIAEEVKATIIAFLDGLGWEAEGDANLKEFNTIDIVP